MGFIRWVLSKIFPQGTWYFKTKEKKIVLTIDDACSQDTNAILDLLAETNTKACFFVMGSRVIPDIMERIIREGHEIGNHGMEDRPAKDLPKEELIADYNQTEELLNNYYHGQEFRYYRPGSGIPNNFMRELPARIIIGDAHGFDAQTRKMGFCSWLVKFCTEKGSILILHNRDYTLPEFRTVITDLHAKGYEFIKLCDMIHLTEPQTDLIIEEVSSVNDVAESTGVEPVAENNSSTSLTIEDEAEIVNPKIVNSETVSPEIDSNQQ